MMKKTSISAILVGLLCVIVFWLSGCLYAPLDSSQPGETEAEGHRRHIRNVRIEQREMMQDLDRMFLLDQPSKLTDKKIP